MNGFYPEGLELNERAAQNVRIAGFIVHTKPLEEFHPEKPFNVVVLSNVIEHSLNPKELLNNVRRVLKPEGHVMILCQLFFPLLWLGNLTNHGDCLVVEAGLKSKT